MTRRAARRRSRAEMEATGQRQDLTAAEIGELWRACCASTDGHRFDCRECAPEKRGRGPFRTVTPATPRQVDDLIRRSSPGSGLDDIKTRGIDTHIADLERELNPRSIRRTNRTGESC